MSFIAHLFTLMRIILLIALISSFYALHCPPQRLVSQHPSVKRLNPSYGDFKKTLNFSKMICIFFIPLFPGSLITRYIFNAMAIRFKTFHDNLNLLTNSTAPKLSISVLWILIILSICNESLIDVNLALVVHLFHDANLYPDWAVLRSGSNPGSYPHILFCITCSNICVICTYHQKGTSLGPPASYQMTLS